MMYDEKRHPVNVFKAQLKQQAGPLFDEPLIGPVRLAIAAVFTRPKSKTRKTRPNPREWHTGRPDVDNCSKAVLDALTGIVYRNDNQVCELRVEKWVAAADEAAYTTVVIEEA
jgi:Holliday junction resolvase RusA-like endonuclease